MLDLAARGGIRHTVRTVRFEEVNETIDALGRGDVAGRAVLVCD